MRPSHAAGRQRRRRRRPIADRRRSPGPAARWSRNSRLPSGPRIGDAMTSRVPEPERRGRLRRPARAPRGGSPGRGRRRGPSGRLPASNWGLTSATIVAAAGRERRGDGPEDQAERDERDVDRRRGRSARAASAAVSVRAFVRSIETTRGSRRSDSASWPRPDVDGVDAARAALEQHVREAAGRGADVEADAARRVDRRTRRARRRACGRRG